jgi:integrase
MEVPREARISVARDLLINLGLRASELCNANVGDLSTVQNVHYISVTVKGGHHRTLPISNVVAERLKLWLESRPKIKPGDPLLLDGRGQRLDRGGLSYICRSIGKAAGITRFVTTPHTVRHTLNLVRRIAKIDPTTRSALLTHTSPVSIASYEHLLPQELVDARREQDLGLVKYLASADDTSRELTE